jgi:hypothetical protein
MPPRRRCVPVPLRLTKMPRTYKVNSRVSRISSAFNSSAQRSGWPARSIDPKLKRAWRVALISLMELNYVRFKRTSRPGAAIAGRECLETDIIGIPRKSLDRRTFGKERVARV